MIIIELTYKKSLDEVNEYLEEHRAFLQKQYDKGVFLASGPKEPRVGGIIIALADKETMDQLIQEDPFYKNQIADYRLIQFDPVKYCKEIEGIINK